MFSIESCDGVPLHKRERSKNFAIGAQKWFVTCKPHSRACIQPIQASLWTRNTGNKHPSNRYAPLTRGPLGCRFGALQVNKRDHEHRSEQYFVEIGRNTVSWGVPNEEQRNTTKHVLVRGRVFSRYVKTHSERMGSRSRN